MPSNGATAPPSPAINYDYHDEDAWGEPLNLDTIKLAKKVASRMKNLEATDVRQATLDSIRAIMMIRAYRVRGHLVANLDPLRLESSQSHLELDPHSYGFFEKDLDRPIFIDNVLGLETATAREILTVLRNVYCGTLAIEFMHISSPNEKAWLQERIEGPDKGVSFTQEGKRAILWKLLEAEGFEKYLNTKYTGTKRFGLDGGESMLPALEQIIKRGGNLGVKDIVIGMPHRGRLNILANVMAKPARAIFQEFDGENVTPEGVEASGDVKYHKGVSSDRIFDDNRVHLSLASNPSHLEAVDPVVLGKARAKQDAYGGDRTKVIPLLLHGDAAFAGQGIVAECFELSALKGHKSGGSIHFIVNNQIGFTTNPRYSRSSPYPSDVAKVVEAPIFHVNGDDPEAVVYAAKIATEFRQKFGKPVVIDMFCYRRHGHNEGDEPSFTQPFMYQKIKNHPTTLAIYSDKLIKEGVVSPQEVEEKKSAFRALLNAEFSASVQYKVNKADWLEGRWAKIKQASPEKKSLSTGVKLNVLKKIGTTISTLPEDKTLHKTVRRIFDTRRKSVAQGYGIDWATAEALSFAVLLHENHGVRITGQDTERGTFSQRHAVIFDQATEERLTPLDHVSSKQARFEVVNSMLSEAAVLGFEYGYSTVDPSTLVIWEAQYGDFANGAQVIIDQFVASAERKWLRASGLVMLLPHGYEGQGPEHSSARLERYLQLCAENNMQVVYCTTPANYFHVLRRQVLRDFRKPLIVMAPKSLLRERRCVSTLKDMGPGSHFQPVLLDDKQRKANGKSRDEFLLEDKDIRRVILCSGKVYYDLLLAREANNLKDVYIIRLEEIYPFPRERLLEILPRFLKATVVWCQEEPHNMGAWFYIVSRLEALLKEMNFSCQNVLYAGRPESAAPATGLLSSHLAQKENLLTVALTG